MTATTAISYGWLIALCVGVLMFFCWRTFIRLLQWADYWHGEWLNLGKEKADLDTRLANLQSLCDKQDQQIRDLEIAVGRRRSPSNASVPPVWAITAEGVVSAVREDGRREDIAQFTVPGVPAAGGQCAPGAASWSRGWEGLGRVDSGAVGAAGRAMPSVPPNVEYGLPCGPPGGGGERGPARATEPAAVAPAVQSPQGEAITEGEQAFLSGLATRVSTPREMERAITAAKCGSCGAVGEIVTPQPGDTVLQIRVAIPAPVMTVEELENHPRLCLQHGGHLRGSAECLLETEQWDASRRRFQAIADDEGSDRP